MNWAILVSAAVLCLILTGLLYWQLSLAEGVYLGSRVVVWLYDRFAPRYDKVKQFNENDEAWFLGGPLARALQGVNTSIVLDVATGTARMPLALFRQPTFTGRIIGLDLSRAMLREAAIKNKGYRDRLTLLWQDATQLPFSDEAFDAVTCLEALEFLPDANHTLTEIVRVLRPGGIFLVSNRVGPGARWLPRRTMNREAFAKLLESLSLTDVHVAPWQIDYDIAWGRKSRPLTQIPTQPGQWQENLSSTLPNMLRCPHCPNISLTREDEAFFCQACGRRYPIAQDGVVELAHSKE
jgi:ubiquinone/menaquinone biosynthesis C-methylase UbiE